jgi:hypothetical protein
LTTTIDRPTQTVAEFAERAFGVSGVDASPAADDGSDPSPGDLTQKLNDFGQAPGSTSVTNQPPAPADPSQQNEQQTLLGSIQTLESYINVLAAWVVYSKHPAEYDLSNPQDALQCVIDIANARNYILTGGAIKAIPMYLPGMSTSAETQTMSTSTATFHADFLNLLFGSLGLDAAVLKQLDGVLTDVSDTLKNLKLSFQTQSQSFDNALSYYYFQTVDGTNPPLQQVCLRFIFMQIEQASWKAAIAKSSVEHFDFDLTLYVSDSVMNANLVGSNALDIAASCQKFANLTPEQIASITGQKTVNGNS